MQHSVDLLVALVGWKAAAGIVMLVPVLAAVALGMVALISVEVRTARSTTRWGGL